MTGDKLLMSLIVWGVLICLGAVGYLLKLEIREFLSLRRLNAQRARLGLPRL